MRGLTLCDLTHYMRVCQLPLQAVLRLLVPADCLAQYMHRSFLSLYQTSQSMSCCHYKAATLTITLSALDAAVLLLRLLICIALRACQCVSASIYEMMSCLLVCMCGRLQLCASPA